MKIECKLRRDGGSHIDFGSVTYHFAADKNGRHVADVTDKEHVGRLLSIPEAYQIADDEAPAPKVKSAPVKDAQKTLDPVESTGDEEGDGDNDGDEGDSDAEKQAYATERAALAVEYTAIFGKAPHHKVTNESIRQKLAEKLAEKGA